MTVNFDIVPRQALTAADFKALGRAIRRWLRLHAKQQGSVRWYDSDSLEALLKGQPPRAQAAEVAASISEGLRGDIAAAAVNVALLDHVDTETPRPFCLSLIYNKNSEPRHVLASVRRALPTDLVAEVFIDGRSWDDPAHAEWIGVRPATR